MTLRFSVTGILLALPVLLAGSLTAAAPAAAPSVPVEPLAQLASDQFETRQKAYEQLREWAEKNIESSPEALHGVWRQSEDPEVKSRCYQLMRELLSIRKFGRGWGFIGISMEEIQMPGKEAVRQAVRINGVLPDTPAVAAGLEAGDVILRVDDQDLDEAPERLDAAQGLRLGFASMKLSSYIRSREPGDKVTLQLMRGDKLIQVAVILTKHPNMADVKADRQAEDDLFFKQWLGKMAQ